MTKLTTITTLTKKTQTMMHTGKAVDMMRDQTIGKNVQRKNKSKLNIQPTPLLFKPSSNSIKGERSMEIKLTDKEREELDRYFTNPAFQMTPRHALYTAHKVNSLKSTEQRRKELGKFARDESFLFNFTHDYFFYRVVKKNEITKEGYWRQIEEISYLILLDLLHPEKATPTESWHKPEKSSSISNSPSHEWLGERQLRRIRDEYPEIFYTPHDCHQNKKDRRESRYLTVFSDLPLENDESWSTALEMLTAQDIARAEIMDISDLMRVRQVMSGLRMVDPEDLIGLERFWQIQKNCLETLTAKYKQSTHNKWLPRVLRERTNLLEHMYQFIDQAVGLHWYRNIKSEPKKERLMHERAPWIYTEEDAKKAVELTFKWFENSATATDLISRGADTYAHLEMFNVSLWLYDECLKQPLIQASEKGFCYFKTACIYSQIKDWEKCFDSLTKSLSVYGEQGDKYGLGTTWGYIAEASHMINNFQKYEEAKNQAMSILKIANTSDESSTEAYLDIADSAQRTKDAKWEEEALRLSFDSASKLKDPAKEMYIIQRLGDLITRKDTSIAEQEPNKLHRPSQSRWETSLIHFKAKVPKS